MRILIACEFSGVVREAFLGGDVTLLLKQEWDLVIAHPPCTYLANSGVRWLFDGPGERYEPRWEDLKKGAEFFNACLDANAEQVAVENPIQHKYAVELIARRPSQIIQPWQFGHGETKATCLWLKNLSPLVPTYVVDERKQTGHYLSPSPWRAYKRAVTFRGVAEAMANQWG